MSGYAFAIGLCVVVVALLFFLLRTRRIREKYAGVWILLTVAVLSLGIFPGLAVWLSDLVGVETPVNLLFALAFVVVLALCIQLSAEVSSLEEETRTLAEEIALLRLEMGEVLGRGLPASPASPADTAADTAADTSAGTPDPTAEGTPSATAEATEPRGAAS